MVKGFSGTYSVFGGFCSCRNFPIRVCSGVPYCKHVIAVHFAEAIGTVKEVELAPGDFETVLSLSL